MKNKGLILTLVTLSSLLTVGCNNQSNEESFDDSTNDKSDSNDNNQALYNRIILDYYEQKLCKSGFATKEENGVIINIVNDGKTWSKINSYVGRQECDCDEIVLGCIRLVVGGQSNRGGYICSFDSPICEFASGYHDAYSTTLFVDGQNIGFHQRNLPFVWYQGAILDICEAYELDLIEVKDLRAVPHPFSPEANHFLFNDKVPVFNTGNKYVIENHWLNSLKNKYCNYFITNNYGTIDGSNLLVDDVHVFDSFGSINGKQMLVIACDNVQMKKTWSENLVCDDISIAPFTLYEPLFYINDYFYSIVDAFDSGLIDKNDVLLINKLFN